MKLKIAALIAILTMPAMAQSGPPAGFFPPDMPNIGRVWIYECLAGINYNGWGPCLRVEPEAWGQLCDPSGASFAASSWHEHNKPFSYIFRASWWKCQSQMNPKTAPWPMHGPL